MTPPAPTDHASADQFKKFRQRLTQYVSKLHGSQAGYRITCLSNSAVARLHHFAGGRTSYAATYLFNLGTARHEAESSCLTSGNQLPDGKPRSA